MMLKFRSFAWRRERELPLVITRKTLRRRQRRRKSHDAPLGAVATSTTIQSILSPSPSPPLSSSPFPFQYPASLSLSLSLSVFECVLSNLATMERSGDPTLAPWPPSSLPRPSPLSTRVSTRSNTADWARADVTGTANSNRQPQPQQQQQQ